MKMSIIVVMLLGSLMQGCCDDTPRLEPTRPDVISGWQDRKERGLHILGEFVLNDKESTASGKVQIKVVKIVPGESCVESGSERRNARAVLQFVKLSDGAILCEDTFLEKSSTLLPSECRSNADLFGLLSVYVNGINIKDGWVHFTILG